MEIRRLGEEDAASWWHLRREALLNEPLAFGSSLAEHERTSVQETAARFRALPGDSFTLGAFDDGRLIGIAAFVRDQSEKRRHKAHIFGVYVSAAYRGRGVAKQMMSAILERARQYAWLEQILISASAGNAAANRIYQKFGFEVYGTEPAALKVGGEYADEVFMTLRVPQG